MSLGSCQVDDWFGIEEVQITNAFVYKSVTKACTLLYQEMCKIIWTVIGKWHKYYSANVKQTPASDWRGVVAQLLPCRYYYPRAATYCPCGCSWNALPLCLTFREHCARLILFFVVFLCKIPFAFLRTELSWCFTLMHRCPLGSALTC